MSARRFIASAAPALLAAIAVALAAVPATAATPSTALSPALGMRLDGRLWHQHAGFFIARAGDVNGDGLADVLVGTWETHIVSPRRPSPSFNLYVVFGRRGPRGRVVRLDRLGAHGLRVISRDGFSSGAGAGDVNGDGLADVVLGTSFSEGSTGAYVVFGRRAGGTVDADRLGRGGFAVRFGAAIDAGAAVAGAGDLDRDGLADVVVADPSYVPPGGEFGTGRAIVVFGRRGFSPVDVGRAGTGVTTIIGPGPFHMTAPVSMPHGVDFAGALAGVGDMTGDGRPDLAIGASRLGGREGGAFVVAGGFRRGATIDLRRPERGWYRISGSGGNAAGSSLAAAGDVDGDGLADLLVGGLAGGDALASSHGPSFAYVVHGDRRATDVALSSLGAAGTVLVDATSGDRAGQSVAGTGDVTGDGRPDLLVGAPLGDPAGVRGAGSTFLVPGGRLGARRSLRDLTAPARRFDGLARFDMAGSAVAGIGDFNGDGARDLAIAAARTDVLSEQSGSVYLVYGHTPRGR